MVEKYLCVMVDAAGGATRKFSSELRPNNPDQIVIWPQVDDDAMIHFVECKAPGRKPRPGQVREHARLRAMRCAVWLLDTKAKVDAYVDLCRA